MSSSIPSPAVVANAIPSTPSFLSPYDPNKAKAARKNDERSALIFIAKLAEKAERWDDVLKSIRELLKLVGTQLTAGIPDADLTDEEKQLMFLSYKAITLQLRTAWKNSKYDEWNKYNDVIDEFKSYVEKELTTLAADIVNILETTFVKTVTKDESKVFYMKITGDYYRYLAEVQPIKGYERRALDFYNQAYRIACSRLMHNNPVRLSVALNYSVCLYEIFRDKKQAVEVAKTAFDIAIQKLDDLEEGAYKDATLIMQLIRDNLTFWTQAEQQAQEAK